MKFRRGKKFQEAYFEIGCTNCDIANLLIEADVFEKHGNKIEADDRRQLAEKFRNELLQKYSPDFDTDFYLPQVSGYYVRRSRRCVL